LDLSLLPLIKENTPINEHQQPDLLLLLLLLLLFLLPILIYPTPIYRRLRQSLLSHILARDPDQRTPSNTPSTKTSNTQS
jgi:hypothetical protein